MKIAKAVLESKAAAELLENILPSIQEKYDVLEVDRAEYSIPWVFADGSEGYVNILVRVKRSKDGHPYDGYEEAAQWQETKKALAAEAEKREEKKRAEEAKRKARESAKREKFKQKKGDVLDE